MPQDIYLPEDLRVLDDFCTHSGFYTFVYRKVTGSTNEEAKDLARAGAPEGLLLIADEQEQGRGRRMRKWFSPPGVNLYFSLLLRPHWQQGTGRTGLINLAACLAVTAGIKDETGLDVRPGWPNDIYLAQRKTAGILSESLVRGQAIECLITGIGINVNTTVNQFPEELKERATSLLIEANKPVHRGYLACRVLERFLSYYQRLQHSTAHIVDEWTALSTTIGSRVRVSLEESEFEALAIGIDATGHLKVRLSSGEIKTLSAADVVRVTRH